MRCPVQQPFAPVWLAVAIAVHCTALAVAEAAASKWPRQEQRSGRRFHRGWGGLGKVFLWLILSLARESIHSIYLFLGSTRKVGSGEDHFRRAPEFKVEYTATVWERLDGEAAAKAQPGLPSRRQTGQCFSEAFLKLFLSS